MDTETQDTPPRTAETPVEVAVSSEKGLREENQDWLSWIESPRGELFIIADGMGGYKGGARAAKMTVDLLEKYLAEAPADWPFPKALDDAIRRTNLDVHQAAHSGNPETENMGSTVVVALVSDGKVQIGHVGDSRAYLYGKGRLRRLTRDHTRVQQMIDAEMITRKQARNHPDSHILSRAIGSRPDVEMEIGPPHKLDEGDALLLCSDGLSGFVPDVKIRKVLEQQTDVQSVASDLVNLALSSGSNDNITIQYIRFGKAVRERVTARLPIPARPIPAFSLLNVLEAVSKRPAVAWTTLVVALVAAAAIPLLALRPPTLAFDSKIEGRQVVLTWKAEKAESLDIQPAVQNTPLKLEGMVTVALPVTSLTYTATATGKRLMLLTLKSEKSLTIDPPPAAVPGAAPEAEAKPSSPVPPDAAAPAATTPDETGPASATQTGGVKQSTPATGTSTSTRGARTGQGARTNAAGAVAKPAAIAPTPADKVETGPTKLSEPAAPPAPDENPPAAQEETPATPQPVDGVRDPQAGGREENRLPRSRG